jgi:integrase
VLRYAVATGRAQHDVAADLKDALAPVKSKNFASVTDPARVGELLRAIDGYTGHPVTALALKLAPLVFVRPGELRAAEWSEFHLPNAEWRTGRRPLGIPTVRAYYPGTQQVFGMDGSSTSIPPAERSAFPRP